MTMYLVLVMYLLCFSIGFSSLTSPRNPCTDFITKKVEKAAVHLGRFNIPLPLIVILSNAFHKSAKDMPLIYLPHYKQECPDYRHRSAPNPRKHKSDNLTKRDLDHCLDYHFILTFNYHILKMVGIDFLETYLSMVWPGTKHVIMDYSKPEFMSISLTQSYRKVMIGKSFVDASVSQIFFPGDLFFTLPMYTEEDKKEGSSAQNNSNSNLFTSPYCSLSKGIAKSLCVVFDVNFEGSSDKNEELQATDQKLLCNLKFETIDFPKQCPCEDYKQCLTHRLPDPYISIVNVFCASLDPNTGIPFWNKWKTAMKWINLYRFNECQLSNFLKTLSIKNRMSIKILALIIKEYLETGRFKTFQMFFGEDVRFEQVFIDDLAKSKPMANLCDLFLVPNSELTRNFILGNNEYAIILAADDESYSLAIITEINPIQKLTIMAKYVEPNLNIIHSHLLYHLYYYHHRRNGERDGELETLFGWAFKKFTTWMASNEVLAILEGVYLSSAQMTITCTPLKSDGKIQIMLLSIQGIILHMKCPTLNRPCIHILQHPSMNSFFISPDYVIM